MTATTTEDPETEEAVDVASEVQGEHDEPDDLDVEVGDAQRDTVAADVERSPRYVVLATVTILVVLSALTGSLGWQAYQSNRTVERQARFLEAGRQGAVDLTTIDWQQVDTDVQRILSASTGAFYDEFSKRSEPFIDVVKKSRSTSVGTVTGIGLESQSRDDAAVLVAVNVKTTVGADPQAAPRGWRMRISVHDVAGTMKISNVEFVP
jgi:Mce-associated membrane protein